MILLIDGNNIAYRSFYTPQGALQTKQGEPSGVILGTLNSIKGYLERFPEVTKVIVVWDAGRAEWRKEIFPEYKATRSYGDTPEEKEKFDGLFDQMNVLHENLPSFGVESIKVGGWEADDIIAVVCDLVTLEDKEKKVMVVTSDKDMLQLVSDNVSVYTPSKKKVISPFNFYTEAGTTQDAYLGYRALVGDPSDNIKGVKGIGEKTAKGLMDTWGHIDNVLGSQGANRDLLMKSKRTARIFEQENLNILGINNKIMSFKYIPEDEEVISEVNRALDTDNYSELSSRKVKDFFIKWQFLSNLTNYMVWIMPFLGLGEED